MDTFWFSGALKGRCLPHLVNALFGYTKVCVDVPDDAVEGQICKVFVDGRVILGCRENVDSLSRESEGEWFTGVAKVVSLVE